MVGSRPLTSGIQRRGQSTRVPPVRCSSSSGPSRSRSDSPQRSHATTGATWQPDHRNKLRHACRSSPRFPVCSPWVTCDATRPSASRRPPGKAPGVSGSCTSTSPLNDKVDERARATEAAETQQSHVDPPRLARRTPGCRPGSHRGRHRPRVEAPRTRPHPQPAAARAPRRHSSRDVPVRSSTPRPSRDPRPSPQVPGRGTGLGNRPLSAREHRRRQRLGKGADACTRRPRRHPRVRMKAIRTRGRASIWTFPASVHRRHRNASRLSGI